MMRRTSAVTQQRKAQIKNQESIPCTLAMKTTRPCLIVGASGHIGQAIALELLSHDRTVALTRTGKTRGGEITALQRDSSRWYDVDVTKPDEVRRVLREIERDLDQVPDLVYAAGIVRDASIALMSDASWSDVVNTNLSGAFYFIRGISERLMAVEHGRIVMIGSIAASIGRAGQAAYAASKAGLEALCRIVASEVGRHGVTCNVIAPGGIEGSMLHQTPDWAKQAMINRTPMRKLGQTQDIARLAAYLLSRDAGHISGQTIHVDGGASAT